MKYKNRLIIPTLISTALFGAALNAEAEEITKEESLEVPSSKQSEVSEHPQEETAKYINEQSDSPSLEAEHEDTDSAPSAATSNEQLTPPEEEPSKAPGDTQIVNTENQKERIPDESESYEESTGGSLQEDETSSEHEKQEALQNVPEGNDEPETHGNVVVTDSEHTENQTPEDQATPTELHTSLKQEHTSDGDEDSEVKKDSPDGEEIDENSHPQQSQLPEKDDQDNTSVENDETDDASTEEDEADDASTEEDEAEDTSTEEDEADDASTEEDEAEDTSTEENEADDTSDEEDEADDASTEEDEADDTSDEEDEADDASTEEDEADDTSDENEENDQREIITKLKEGPALFSFASISNDADSPEYSEASYAAKIKSARNSGIFSPLTNKEGVSAQTLLDHTLFINRRAIYKGDTYYLINREYEDRMQGWMKEKDLNLWTLSDEKRNTRSYALTNRSGALLTDPWGTEKQQKANLNSYGEGTVFQAEKTVNLGALTFHYGKLGNDYGWVQETKVKDTSVTPVHFDASYAAKIKSSNNSGVFSPLTRSTGVSARSLQNQTLYTDKKAVYKGDVFYLINREYGDRMQGWMKEKDLNLWSLSEKKRNTRSYALTNRSGALLTDPWGTEKQQKANLKSYGEGTVFQAEKTVNLGALTFHYGKLGNDYGWVQETKVKDTSVDPVYFDSSYAAKIRSGNNSGLYSPITSTSGKSANVLMDRTLFTNKKAVYKGNTFYLIYREYGDRMQGWMKEKDLNLWNLSEENKHNKTYSLSSRTGGLSTDPWGTSKQYINPLTAYQEGAVFQAEKTLNLGALTFHYGKIGNDYGWIQDTKLSDYVPSNPAPEVKTVKYNISLDRAVDIQMNLGSKPQAWANGGGWRNATRSEVAYFINPANHTTDTWDYTYLDLNRAQNISTVELNNKLLNNKGILHNQGTAFLQAANTHGVNEVYLISHALHETGNGQSTLAQGVRLDANGNISSNGKLYYNMYGIAAYDHNPVLEGARYAQRMGWDTPAKAVIGGAQFISGGYFNRGQNTLYAMRWNPANPGTYQYATDVNWAYATARNLKNYYDQLGIRGQYYTRYTF